MGNQVSNEMDSNNSSFEFPHQFAAHVDEMSRFLASSLGHNKKIHPKGKVLFVGLEKSGKTTLIDALCRNANGEDALETDREDNNPTKRALTGGAVSTIPEGSTAEQPEETPPANPKAATATVAVAATPTSSSVPADLGHGEAREMDENNSISSNNSARLRKQPSGIGSILFGGKECLPQVNHPTEKIQTREITLDPEVIIQYIDVPAKRDYHSSTWWTNTLVVDNDKKRHYAMAAHLPTSQKPVHVPLLGVVYVVDVSDQVRFPLVAQELVRIQRIQDKAFKAPNSSSSPKPFMLIVLNKVDYVTNLAFAQAVACAAINSSKGITEETNDKLVQRQMMNQIRRDLQKNYEHLVKNEIKRATNKFLSTEKRVSGNGLSAGAVMALDSVTWGGVDPGRTTGNNNSGDRNDQPTLMSIMLESQQDDSERIQAVRMTLLDEVRKQLDRIVNHAM